MDAFTENKECFLASPGWRACLNRHRCSPPHLDSKQDLSDELFSIMVHLPELKRDALSPELQNQCAATIQPLILRAMRFKHQLTAWYLHYRELAGTFTISSQCEAEAANHVSEEPLCTSATECFPAGAFVSHYTTYQYHASQILVNNALLRLYLHCSLTPVPWPTDIPPLQPSELIHQNELHSRTIRRTTHLITCPEAGLFGPYHAIFGLRMAYLGTSSDDLKVWVKTKVEEMAQKMEVMSSVVD